MRHRLIIAGAGGFGREVAALAEAIPAFRQAYDFAGFLDDNPNALHGKVAPGPVITGIESYEPRADDRFLIAVGNPKLKARFAEVLERQGGLFAQLIHPTAHLGPRVRFGAGCIVYPYTVFTCDIEVGAHGAFYHCASLGHDVRVGRYAQFSAYCDLTGAVTAGERLFMGTHASVLPTCELGDDVTIGAGSVVVKSLPSRVTVFGVPAKVISHESAD